MTNEIEKSAQQSTSDHPPPISFEMVTSKLFTFLKFLRNLLNLKADTDRESTTSIIKSNVQFQSANAWTLVFAIFIASIGLNINSTAVIIGAMLISPLMGPIVGIGFALGINDFDLLKRSSRNLAVAIIISLLTSTIYFLISPLSEIQSELLARTRPSFFDVLIAFFGGAAGIVAVSRKERGNAIPGVAIATALMPPLCTAGFGLATGNLSYFFGALYLFIINSVYISISTFLFVKALGFTRVSYVDTQQQKYINRWIIYIGITVGIPSIFMAWYLQRESFFNSQVEKYISQELRSANSFVVDKSISYGLRNPKIQITVLGEPLDKDDLNILKLKAKSYSLPPESIEIHQSSFAKNLEKKIGEKVSAAAVVSSQLSIRLKRSENELLIFKNILTLSAQVTLEMESLFPGKLLQVILTHQNIASAPDQFEKFETDIEKLSIISTVLVHWKITPKLSEIEKVSTFLSHRLNVKTQQISHVKNING